MLDLTQAILAFVIAISLLVAVHEYGHFWVARRLGVRVLRFSIGFGTRLFGWRTGGVDYWISAVPLGGYVKMLDEREGPVAPAELARAFNRQPPWKRMLIVAAGPGVNFLFAVLLYWAVFMLGVTGLKPILAEVPAQTLAAHSGLRGGEEVLSLDGEPVSDWQQLRLRLLEQALDRERIELVVREPDGGTRSLSLDLAKVNADPDALFGELGLLPARPPLPAIIGEVMPDSAATRAGLQPGDRILSLNDTPVRDWGELVEWVAARPGARVEITVERAGQTVRMHTTLGAVEEQGRHRGRLGAAVDVNSQMWQDLRAQFEITVRRPPGAALAAAVRETWDISVLTLKLLGHMLTGLVSWEHVSGPIQIAQYAGATAGLGLVAYLSFLALVSVSLGVLNLLPVPLLDGGHLLFDALEWLRGRPLSDSAQQVGQRIGIALLAALMTLALYNDIARLISGNG